MRSSLTLRVGIGWCCSPLLRALAVLVLFTSFLLQPLGAADVDEFKIKREQVYEFAKPPTVEVEGDRVTIRFAAKGYCDVTVAIEDADGRIVRHLASGVLGENAPPPLQPGSLEQTLVWDSKNDRDEYVTSPASHVVRVSLGLKPRFEKTLLWEPKQRAHQQAPVMQAGEQGVYVYDGRVIDHLRMFDHQGNYLRTVYPFPANQLEKVDGLHWREMPQDGARMPLKQGFHQATLLTSGKNAGFDEKLGIGVDRHNNYHGSVWGNAATTMAVAGERIALAGLRLNRLSPDGTTGGLPLTGPEVTFPIMPIGARGGTAPLAVSPRCAALSPDGRWLYLTGYVHGHRTPASRDIILIQSYAWLPGVARIDFAGGAKVETFLGSMEEKTGGSGPEQFKTPVAIAVDSAGRIFVADHINDRVQVFSPDGALLNSIRTSKPSHVAVHHRTGQVYVFSWWIPHEKVFRDTGKVPATLTVFESFDNPRVVTTCPLPVGRVPSRGTGLSYRVAFDSWTDPPSIWFAADWGRSDFLTRNKTEHSNIRLYTLHDGALQRVRDFNEDARKSAIRTRVPEYHRQRLYVNPSTGKLYVSEGQAASGKSFRDVLRVDPVSGAVEKVGLPFDAEDMCFDSSGLAYLRTFYHVARFNPVDWSEVPWDYGEEKESISTGSSGAYRRGSVSSALRLPVKQAGLHHHGGMAVSPRGHLVVAVNNFGKAPRSRKDVYDEPIDGGGAPYTPAIFPGRVRWGEIHVWDRHGQLLYQDAVPGLNRTDGVAIDRDDQVYVLSTTTRILDGKRHFNDMTETLLKVKPGKARLVSPAERAKVPLSLDLRPSREPDLVNSHVGAAWLEGAEWFYGGVGFAGKNAGRSGGGCDCYNARFALDDFARAFAPEIEHHSVAVLDTAGNLITRIGKYGNADSAGPRSRVPLGGDEVGLFYAPYLATHTDRRLFIADVGNARVLSVQLDYHTSHRLPLAEATATSSTNR